MPQRTVTVDGSTVEVTVEHGTAHATMIEGEITRRLYEEFSHVDGVRVTEYSIKSETREYPSLILYDDQKLADGKLRRLRDDGIEIHDVRGKEFCGRRHLDGHDEVPGTIVRFTDD